MCLKILINEYIKHIYTYYKNIVGPVEMHVVSHTSRREERQAVCRFR